MKKRLIAYVCALVFANVSSADTTIAASKSLDARVDVVGDKGSEWCDKQLRLKFLTSDGKELSQSVYDQMLPKVQSLLTSQCAKVSTVEINKGKTIEKLSYENNVWTSIGNETVKTVIADTKVATTDISKSNTKVDADKPIADVKVESLKNSETKLQDEYFDLLNEKDFDKIVKKLSTEGFLYGENGSYGFDRRLVARKNEEFGLYKDLILNSNISERKIIDFKDEKKYIAFFVEEKGEYKKESRHYSYMAKDKYLWNKNKKSLSKIDREIVSYEDLEDNNSKANKFGDLETLAFLAETPFDNEVYLNYYVALKNEQLCKQYSKAIKSNDINEINSILSKYEKPAKEYKEKVKSSIKGVSLNISHNMSMSKKDYNEKDSSIRFKMIGSSKVDKYNIKTPCDINIEPFNYSVFTSLNIDSIPVQPRMLTALSQESEYLINIKYEPKIYHYSSGRKVLIRSSHHTKITHVKSDTVLVDQAISKSVADEAFGNYLEEQVKAKKEYDNLSSECKDLKFLFGGNADCK